MSGRGRDKGRRRRRDDDDDEHSKLRNLQAFSKSAAGVARKPSRVSSRSPTRAKSSSSSTSGFLSVPPPTNFNRATSSGGGFQWSTPLTAPNMPSFDRSTSWGAPSLPAFDRASSMGMVGLRSPNNRGGSRSPQRSRSNRWIDPLLNLVQMPTMEQDNNDDQDDDFLSPLQRRVDQKILLGEEELEAHHMALLQEGSDSSGEGGGGDSGGGNDVEEGWTTVNDRVNEFYDGDVETSDPQLAREVASSILFRADNVRNAAAKPTAKMERRKMPSPSSSSLGFHHSRVPYNHKANLPPIDDRRTKICFRIFQFVVLLMILISIGLTIYVIKTGGDVNSVLDVFSNTMNDNDESNSSDNKSIPNVDESPIETVPTDSVSPPQVNSNNELPTDLDQPAATTSITISASASGAASDRLQMLLQVYRARSTGNTAALSDKTSPQYLALEWIADKDPTKIPLTDDTPWKFVDERYALATFFFATGGSSGTWSIDENWLSSKDVCQWHGISCTASGGDGLTETSFGGINRHRVKGIHLSKCKEQGNQVRSSLVFLPLS